MKKLVLSLSLVLASCSGDKKVYERPNWIRVSQGFYYRIDNPKTPCGHLIQVTENFGTEYDTEHWIIDCATWTARRDDLPGDDIWLDITPGTMNNVIASNNCP